MNGRIQRNMIIHFNDGSTKRIDFPAPVADGDANLALRIEEAVNARCLVLESEGTLMVFPVESIKYLQSFPAPRKLPPYAIRGVRFTD
jgi:hypothetical protein